PIRSSSSATRLIVVGQAKASAVKPMPCRSTQAPAAYATLHCTTLRRLSRVQMFSPSRSVGASVTLYSLRSGVYLLWTLVVVAFKHSHHRCAARRRDAKLNPLGFHCHSSGRHHI